MLKTNSYLFAFLILLGFSNQGFAQTEECSCKADLILLNKKIKKTPSYKNNKKLYKEHYLKIAKKAETLESGYECYVLLNKLLIGINDNHCKIYGIDKGAVEEIRKDTEKLNAFKKSPIANVYPIPTLDLDSLRSVLSAKPKNDIEGVYTRIKYLVIGICKYDEDYRAIVLETQNDVWQVGEVIYTLVPYGNNYVLNIGGDIVSKRLIAYPERIENGLFLTMGFVKDTTETNYSVSRFPDSTYVREELSSETTYLKIGSFNSWYPALSDAEAFYKSLDATLNKKNLIIDLRDNGGGGDRNSDVLLEILEPYIKTNKVYVITNNRTASNAEQFAFKLSKFENCKIFGHRTNGTAAYELKSSNHVLPCGNLLAVLTSKKHSKFLEIESKGIEPNVKFDRNSDWIKQLLIYIDSNS